MHHEKKIPRQVIGWCCAHHCRSPSQVYVGLGMRGLGYAVIAVGPGWSRPLVVPVRRVRGVYDFVAASSAAASAARTGAK